MRRSALLIAFAVLVAGCGGSKSSSSSSSGASKVLVGAGSSLVYPIMSKWSSDYAEKYGVTVTYGPIGSGGGIAQITSRSVDFGASDAPLTPDQAKAAHGVIQIPWALAATDVAYNVRGAPNHLKLSGPVLADIFLGKITTWNDPAIAKLNSGAALPATKITPIFRTDGSGDTYAFTDYLSKVSPQWKQKVGVATQVRFPTGLGGKGNSGVGGVLTQTNGGIAYIAISYVVQNKFDYALVQNAAGNYPVPDIASISAAAKAVTTVPADNAISLVDPPASAPDAYPISTYTYVLVPQTAPKAAALRKFITYAIGPGQQFGADLEFAKLPPQVLAADKSALSKLK